MVFRGVSECLTDRWVAVCCAAPAHLPAASSAGAPHQGGCAAHSGETLPEMSHQTVVHLAVCFFTSVMSTCLAQYVLAKLTQLLPGQIDCIDVAAEPPFLNAWKDWPEQTDAPSDLGKGTISVSIYKDFCVAHRASSSICTSCSTC